MSEGARILRPGTSMSTSYSARRNGVTPRVGNGAKTVLGIAPRQMFPSPREPNLQQQLKIYFQTMLNAITAFLSHNNTTNEFRNQFNNQVHAIDTTFSGFIINSPRPISSSSTRMESETPQVQEQVIKNLTPFLKQLARFNKYIKQMRESGNNPIHEAIDLHFTIISDALFNIQKSATGLTGVHDPIIRKTKVLQSQLINLKRNVINVVQNDKDTTKITTEIRGYSRQINTAFSQEFSHSPIGPANIEKLRSQAYSACCAIIHGLRESNVFEADSEKMFIAYDEFLGYLEYFIERSGVDTGLGKLLAEFSEFGEEEEVPEKPIHFDGVNARELIAQAREAFHDNTKFNEFLDKTERCVDDLYDDIERRMVENDGLRGVKKEAKNARKEYDKIVKENERLQKEMEDMKKLMEDNQKQMDEFEENAGNDTRFKKTIVDIIPIIEQFLDKEETEFDQDNDRQVLKVFKGLMKDIFSMKCERCQNFMAREIQINEILSAVTEPEEDCIETAKKAINELKNAKVFAKSKKNEAAQQNQVISQHRDAFFKILAMFDTTVNKTVEIGQFTVQTVADHLSMLKAEAAELVEEKANANRQFTAELMKRLQQILETDTIESIESYLLQIETKIHDLEQEKLKAGIFESTVNSRIAATLNKNKSEFNIRDEILNNLELIDQKLKETQNVVVKEEVKVEPADYSKIGEAVRSLCDLEVAPANEKVIIERIEEFEDKLSGQRKELRESKMIQKRVTDALTKVHDILSKYADPSNMPTPTEINLLCSSSVELADKATRPSAAPVMRIVDITSLCDKALKSGSFTSNTDPRIFLPEISDNYALLNDSIIALKPFTNILNTIFMNFDSQFSCFDPRSSQFQKIKEQVLQLHSALTSLNASKMHNLIFLALSRFVTLLSSIVSGASLVAQ